MLGDAEGLLEGGDYKEQLKKIQGELKSEARIGTMISDVNSKKELWDGKIKILSDTSEN